MTQKNSTTALLDPQVILERVNSETSSIVPPPGFNPLDEPRERLIELGLPPRPGLSSRPAYHAFWEKMFSPPLEFMKLSITLPPFLGLRVNHRHAALGLRTRRQMSSNWSGAYITPRDGLMFTEIHGEWQVPTPVLPETAPSTGSAKFRSTTWIGLDGQRRYYQSSLPQIGTGQYVDSNNGAIKSQEWFAWWQWWTRDGPPVSLWPWPINIPVEAGDLMMCSILVNQDRRSVTFIIENRSKNQIRCFVKNAPYMAVPLKVSGATAEWVTERPSISPLPVLYPLAKYGTVNFRDCIAAAALAPQHLPTVDRRLQECRLINMFEVRHKPERTARISVARMLQKDQAITVYKD